MMEQKHIVIIGGGFAGVNLAQALGVDKNFRVTLVDKNNYNFFPPLIYQVATSFLDASSISYPFRKLFAGKPNRHFRLATMEKVVPEENKIILSNGEISYDYLVFAAGAVSNYFGIENIKQHAIPMKTLSDALRLRNRMLELMELASTCTDPAMLKKLLTVVIAGGGPTGVELSGMFSELKKKLSKEYPELAGVESAIYLVDGGAGLLGAMSKKSQEDTLNALTKMGVNVKLHTQVKDYNNDVVTFASGETIQTSTLIWTAGVSAQAFEGIAAESYGKGKRLSVDRYNKVQGYQDIYAIGDTCIQLTDKNFPKGHPQVAQVAIQQGKKLAKNLLAMVNKKPLHPFVYTDKGSMAIIGKGKAVVDLFTNKLHLKGFIAWVAWLFVHLTSLITHRNRMKTFYNWAVSFFTNDQSLRLIIRPAKEN